MYGLRMISKFLVFLHKSINTMLLSMGPKGANPNKGNFFLAGAIDKPT
jgi:hypothetical protein